MRLSISLDDDLYAVARSLAKAEDCSISAAINKLVRRALEPSAPVAQRNDGFPTVRGARPITMDDVAKIGFDDR